MKSLLLSISFSLFISSAFAQVSFSTDPIRVNEKRIEQRIQEFAKFGINEKESLFGLLIVKGILKAGLTLWT
jgi:beta-ureidopropionase / N-carbamoyl-L-amino-acid hydrolase